MAAPAAKMPQVNNLTTAKVNRAEYAKWYVNKRIADQLPADAHEKMLALIAVVRTARGMYQEYSDMVSSVVIDPAAFTEFLAPDVTAALKKNDKAVIQDLITKEALSFNKSLVRALEFLAEAMSQIDETDEAFMKKLDDHIFKGKQP